MVVSLLQLCALTCERRNRIQEDKKWFPPPALISNSTCGWWCEESASPAENRVNTAATRRVTWLIGASVNHCSVLVHQLTPRPSNCSEHINERRAVTAGEETLQWITSPTRTEVIKEILPAYISLEGRNGESCRWFVPAALRQSMYTGAFYRWATREIIKGLN